MTHISGRIRIAAPFELVFDTVADSRNEPSFNQAMTAAEGDDTVLGWDWQVRPNGWLRAVGPLLGPLGRRMERRIWTGLKHKLENEGAAHSS
jgi:hypothetical protein